MEVIDDFKAALDRLKVVLDGKPKGELLPHLSKAGLYYELLYRRRKKPHRWKESELMPLVNSLGLDPQPFEAFFLYRKLIESKISSSGIKKSKIAEITGLSKWQLQRRFKSPDLFTFEEIEQINQIIHVFD